MSSQKSFLALLLGTFLSAFVQAECFFPDGTSDADGFPCNSTAGAITHCCRTFEGCFERGVCYTQWDSQFYRRSCTDQNWGDGCPTICTNFDRSSPIGMLACSQGTDPTYCCDNTTSASCCSGTNVFGFIPGNILGTLDSAGNLDPPQAAVTITRTSTLNAPQSTTSSDTSSSQSTSSSSTTTSSGSTFSPTLLAAKSSDSTAARTVGLAVGIPLGLLLIAAIGGLFWFFNRRLNQEKAERTRLEEKITGNNDSSSRPPMLDKVISEKGDGDAGHELPGFGGIMPASGRYEMGAGKSMYGDGSSSGGTRV